MTTVVPISRDEERLEAAARWILRLDEGLSPDAEAALEVWLAEHPANPAELVEVARAWDKLDCLSRLADVFPIEPLAEHASPAARSTRRPVTALLAAAACACVFIVVAWLLAPARYADERSRDRTEVQAAAIYDTAIGEQRMVTLSDGTVVNLDTDSRISVAYSASGRRLELFRGQIHVAVQRDPARPFDVIAGDRMVQAVGTAFTVELTAGRELELVVTEGKVKVGVRLTGTGDPAKVRLDSDIFAQSQPVRIVSAGEELIVRESEELVVPVTPEDMEVKLAWRDGRLIFRDEPLGQAIAEIERYTTIDFVFMDESLRGRLISGRYKTGDVDSLLLALRANFGIGYEYDGTDRVLLSRL